MPSYQDGIKTGMLLAATLISSRTLFHVAEIKGDCECPDCIANALQAAVKIMAVVTDEEMLAAVEEDLAAQRRPN